MHLPDPTPDNHIETTFAKDGTGMLMPMRMTPPNEETRAMMLKTGMEHGMEAGDVRRRPPPSSVGTTGVHSPRPARLGG